MNMIPIGEEYIVGGLYIAWFIDEPLMACDIITFITTENIRC